MPRHSATPKAASTAFLVGQVRLRFFSIVFAQKSMRLSVTLRLKQLSVTTGVLADHAVHHHLLPCHETRL